MCVFIAEFLGALSSTAAVVATATSTNYHNVPSSNTQSSSTSSTVPQSSGVPTSSTTSVVPPNSLNSTKGVCMCCIHCYVCKTAKL